MPYPFARCCVQSKKRIGEEIVADAVRTIPVGSSRPGRDVDDAPLRINRHTGPVIGSAAVRPCVLRPSVVTELAGMRDGVKSPAKLAGSHVVRANISRRRRQGLRLAVSKNY